MIFRLTCIFLEINRHYLRSQKGTIAGTKKHFYRRDKVTIIGAINLDKSFSRNDFRRTDGLSHPVIKLLVRKYTVEAEIVLWTS